MRLDKMIASLGQYSRKDVKKLVKNALVTVNGKVAVSADMHIDENNDVVAVGGEELIYREHLYIMMNKPKDVVCATDDNLHRTVLDLLGAEFAKFNLFPAGRLDIDTEGLVLITDDGQLAHRILSPKHHVDKLYYAELDGKVGEEEIEKFKKGIMLDDGYVTKPAKLELIGDGTKAYVTISEGRFHQIKRMFADSHLKVCYLKRLKMGNLELDESLEVGEFRYLTAEEEAFLKSV